VLPLTAVLLLVFLLCLLLVLLLLLLRYSREDELSGAAADREAQVSPDSFSGYVLAVRAHRGS